MKIAVSYKDGEVFQHFGHSEQFKIYETDHNQIQNSEIIGIEGHGHTVVCNALKEKGVNVVLCGGIGQGAKSLLSQYGIHSFGAITGNCDEVVKQYLSGKLEFTTAVTCQKDKDTHTCKVHCHSF